MFLDKGIKLQEVLWANTPFEFSCVVVPGHYFTRILVMCGC